MSGHYFITHSCEAMGDCIPVCPVECIHSARTAEGRKFSCVDQSRCVDCGACMLVCPIEGAVTIVKSLHD
jgi:NAD-dependent dihydropyrimidine dehydrogenase PreA subunit